MAYVKTQTFLGLIRLLLVVLCLFSFTDDANAIWLNHGADISNSRRATGEVLINRSTVRKLKLKWTFFAGKDISATPAIADGVVYFPSWNGFLYALNAFDGSLIWKQNLSQITGLNGTGVTVNTTVSRATPTIANDLLIVGIYGPAYVIAVTRSSGRLVWSTQLDPRPLAVISQSGTFFLGSCLIGVSSLEEILPAQQCCTFRGSFVKLDVRTGAIMWRTYMIPDNGGRLGGYSGAAIWGSSPSIDVIRRQVYIGTGNLYRAPPDVEACQARQNNQTTKPTQPDRCIGPDVHFDSILAINIDTGIIAWSMQLGGYDVFYFACLVPNNPDCPPGPNLDADFGEAPMLLSIVMNGRLRDIVVAVQKSGYAWALDRDNGAIVWLKRAGPGGLEGGGQWGAANDGRTVYTNIVNSNRESFRLAPSNLTTTAGAWVALEANSGQILWSTANPSNDTSHGPVSVVNDLLFAGSVAPNGPLYAMDTRTGEIVWSYNTGATIYGGVSASYGCIYLGNGYTVGVARFHPTWTPGTSLYAFCISV
ncbi:hypothetical protein K2173_022039 [Erythroxylum novogranatense]|uniref:Pyrrolo-quinoline quinone repeat domain-containing protein n=1 Tax=Erythroxylum novogranatense TaxID=1862640 RepID=A0AAV8T2L6_9ROSI|nr:hypothetical protein K2173_022039 [Erythroxylum novogranatense]